MYVLTDISSYIDWITGCLIVRPSSHIIQLLFSYNCTNGSLGVYTTTIKIIDINSSSPCHLCRYKQQFELTTKLASHRLIFYFFYDWPLP